MAKYLTPEQVQHRKTLQNNLTTGAAGLGLAAVGAKTGGSTLKLLKKAPKTAHVLGHVTNITGTTAGGLGSASALIYQDTRMNKRPRKNAVTKSAFGIDHEVSKLFDPEARRNRRTKAEVGGLAAGSGASAAMSLRRVKQGESLKYPSTHKGTLSHIKNIKIPNVKRVTKLPKHLKPATTNPKAAAVGYGAAAIGLGGAAILAERHRRRGGQSYGDYYER